MMNEGYTCPKCGCTSFEHDTVQTTGGNFSKIFDVQNKKFTAVSCTQCGYTEFYKQKSSMVWNIVDFLMRGK